MEDFFRDLPIFQPKVVRMRGLLLTWSLAEETSAGSPRDLRRIPQSLQLRSSSGLLSWLPPRKYGKQWWPPGVANPQGWFFFLWSTFRGSSYNAPPPARRSTSASKSTSNSIAPFPSAEVPSPLKKAHQENSYLSDHHAGSPTHSPPGADTTHSSLPSSKLQLIPKSNATYGTVIAPATNKALN